MTIFKISFSSDSQEGLRSLAGLSASAGRSDTAAASEGTQPPPSPSSQSMGFMGESSGNRSLGTPPPLPGGYSSDNYSTNHIQGVPPPQPSAQGGGMADGMSSEQDQLAPPPLPLSGSMAEGGGSAQKDPPPLLASDLLSSNAEGTKSGKKADAPSSPPKKQAKRSRKPSK